MEWLVGAGHACRVLTTAQFENPVTFTVGEHLAARGVSLPGSGPTHRKGFGRARRPAAVCPVVRYAVGSVPVTMLVTRHNDEARPNRAETAPYLTLLSELLDDFAPDQPIACNAHPMILEAMGRARRRGVTTSFAVRGFGYYDRRYFTDVEHVFTCSRYLTDHYREKVGLNSTPIDPPIDWGTVVAPTETRAFVTFVHPALHKGLLLFARLADMLGSRRPDIPVLVVQSGQSGGALNGIAGLDVSRYPQIMAAPPVPTPADYFALTRLLLVPSVWPEPFGRVAAEAMINGVPPLVSDRGGLPDVVGGDFAQGGGRRVLPLPDWMTPERTRLPSEHEVAPWFDAVCALWDDAALHGAVMARARALAAERYSEERSRSTHVEFFTSRTPGDSAITGAGATAPGGR